MVSPVASTLTASRFPAAASRERFCQLGSSFIFKVHKKNVTLRCSSKFPRMQQFSDPTKLVVFLKDTKEKLWELMPDSVKQFPWRKAERAALQELQDLVKETLKWSVLAYFALSSPSDILYSISRNKELMVPLGLFVGITIAKYLDEISQELSFNQKDEVSTWILVGIPCFFVLVKFITGLVSGANDFLLHVGNGGLMQSLWNWRRLPAVGEKPQSEDVTASMKTEDSVVI